MIDLVVTVSEAGLVECEWGTLVNTEGDPAKGWRPLIIITRKLVDKHILDGPQIDPFGSFTSVRWMANGDLFFAAENGDQRCVWKLHAARWWDGEKEPDIMIGRWMD